MAYLHYVLVFLQLHVFYGFWEEKLLVKVY
jgi:hypothetical protein